MSRRLLLEGTDLEALMVRVRAELGPRARVVKAERVRSGGVGGFFAKERFELTVDVPDDVPVGLRPSPSPTPSPVPVSVQRAGAAGTTPDAESVTAVGLDALLAAADAADRHGTDPGRGAGDRMGDRAGAGVPESPGEVSTEQDTFATVLDSVRQLAYETTAADAAARSAAARNAAGYARAGGSGPVRPGGLGASGGPAGRHAEPAVRGEVLAKTVTPAEFVVVRRRGATLDELDALGVPRRILARLPPAQGRYTLSEVLSYVPRAPEPVRAPAAVVVVAGQGEAVVAAAAVIARRLGVADAGIALAGRLAPHTGYGPWVLTSVSARRLRAATVESESALVVALGVGTDASDWAIATALTAAFDPDQMWAVVEADRNVLDVRRWMAATSEIRRYDAIIASNVASTSAPATILDFDTPIGIIDTLPASAPVWAAMLSEHLADPQWD